MQVEEREEGEQKPSEGGRGKGRTERIDFEGEEIHTAHAREGKYVAV